VTTQTLPFSALLRERTAAAHAAAESAPFLAALAEGRVTREGVVGLFQRLVPVYDALEGLAVVYAEHPDVAPLLVPGLERADRLRADLASLGASSATTSAAATAYGERVLRAGSASPQAYVGHHYTRYLGDLSGGQIIGRALKLHLGVEGSFFAFPDLRGPAVKQAYRAHLDDLPWNAEEQAVTVAEADVAFDLNRLLAAELEGEVRG